MSDLDDPAHPLRALLDAPCCLWFGLPPCPLCGTDHGDPKATTERDANLRRQVAEHRRAKAGT